MLDVYEKNVRRMIPMLSNTAAIGKNAKHARESSGFSQANVADFLNVDQSLISKFEKGERSIQTDMLEQLANLYGYRLSEFEREDGITEHQMRAAYRSSGILADDMEAIHDIRRIALNLFFMADLTGGDTVER
jgi:transcriptional regulator with XRE-family HTH domain